VQATFERPVLRRPRYRFAIRPLALTRTRHRAVGLVGWVTATLVATIERLRRPVLYLGCLGAVCHGLWQIWVPLGWFGLAASLYLIEAVTGPAEETGQP
jgi:hypothetical protein